MTPPDKTIALAPRFALERFPHEGAVILSVGDRYEVLQGLAPSLVLERLDRGATSVQNLVAELEGCLTPEEVIEVIAQLYDEEIVVEHVRDLSEEELAIAVRYQLPPVRVREALSERRIALVSSGIDDLALNPEEPFRLLGLQFSRVAQEASLVVAVAKDWRDESLLQVESSARARHQDWLPVVLGGARPFVGPAFGRTSDVRFSDLYQRLNDRDRFGRFMMANGRLVTTPSHRLAPPAIAQILYFAADEVLNWLIEGKSEKLENRLWTFGEGTWQPSPHPLLPYVTAVESNVTRPRIPVLRSQKKTDPKLKYRLVPPEVVYEKWAHLLDPVTGVFRNERRLTTPPGGLLHTFQVEHDILRQDASLAALYMNEHGVSFGKGTTAVQAQAGAVGEGAERLSSVHTGSEFTIKGSFRELEFRGAIGLRPLLGFSDRQYAEREEWNQKHPSPTLFVPEPLDPETPIEWVPVWSLTDELWRYVPACFAFLSYNEGHLINALGDSNGNASGFRFEGAVFQALLELVERDAVALWWYNRTRMPGVDLDSLADPYPADLRTYYQEVLRRDMHVLDLTSDIGLPTFAAISRRHDRQPEDIVMGFGTHLDIESAVKRAVTEMNQGLHHVLRENPDGTTRYSERLDPDRRAWFEYATVAEREYLLPDPRKPLVTVASYEYEPKADLLDDLRYATDHVEAQGFEVCVMDLTRAHLGIPVAKVIVPGLLHWWRRLGLRRLYEAPVRLGRLDKPLEELRLNPESIMF